MCAVLFVMAGFFGKYDIKMDIKEIGIHGMD
jgi:hypothetical protein